MNIKDLINEKKLFIPGPGTLKMNININFSHRSEEFKKLYRNVKNR